MTTATQKRQRAWYVKNRKRVLAKMAARYKNNPGPQRERTRAAYWADRASAAEYHRRYRADNQRRIRARKRAHYRRNRVKILAKYAIRYAAKRDHYKAKSMASYRALVRTPDGRQAVNARNRAWVRKNRRKVLTAKRALYRRDRDQRIAAQRLYRQRNREKVRARKIVATALLSGRLIRRPCEVCGSIKSEAHHNDYRRPLSVRWFCRKHHAEQHRLRRSRGRSTLAGVAP